VSLKAMNWCVEQNELTPGEWVVLFHLCHCHNHETGRCDPSQGYLAERTNMGERTVRRHLAALEDQHLIRRVKRNQGSDGRMSDHYILGFMFEGGTTLPANLAATLPANSCRSTGQFVQINRPTVAAKQGRTGKNREEGSQASFFNEEESPKKRSISKPFPDDWSPSETCISTLKGKGYSEAQIADMAEACRDYHISKGNTFKNHDAALRTWARREKPLSGGAQASPAKRSNSEPRRIDGGDWDGISADVARIYKKNGKTPADYWADRKRMEANS